MKSLLLVMATLLIASVSAAQYQGGVAVRPFGSNDSAVTAWTLLDAVQQSHASIVPGRLTVTPTGYGYPDQMTSSLLVQPLDFETDCNTSAQSPLPVQSWIGTGRDAGVGCTITLGGYYAQTFDNQYNAVAVYRTLFPQYRATAFILSTNAGNAKYVLMVQAGFISNCP